MADQLEVIAVAHRLHACGARLGASQILFNALSQRQAAQAGDLAQRPAFGRRVEAAEHLHAPNDNQPDTSARPAPSGGGL